jgi:hypothetical protein
MIFVSCCFLVVMNVFGHHKVLYNSIVKCSTIIKSKVPFMYATLQIPTKLTQTYKDADVGANTSTNQPKYLKIFITTRPNFNYFGNFHNYDATIKIFILLVRSILHLFSSINRLICPISRNNHQINYILKLFYNDIRCILMYVLKLYVCI